MNDTFSRLLSDMQRDFGLTEAQARGFVGNLAHETGGFKHMQEISPLVPGSRGGFGFAQWTGPRRKDFESWSAASNLDPTSYEANYGFLSHELKNTPEGRVLNDLRKAGTIEDATRIVSEQFLRPGIPHMESRVKYAGGDATGLLSPTVSTQNTEAPMQPEKAGGLLGMLFPDMTADRADRIQMGLAGATYRPNIGAMNAAQSRIDQRAQGAQQAQAQSQELKLRQGAAKWIAETFGNQELAAGVLGGYVSPQQAIVLAQNAAKGPDPVKGTEINGQLVNPITGEVIGDYRDADKTTTAFQTLDQRARAAGLEPGTPEYMRFMAEGGAANGMSLQVGADGSVRFTQGKQEAPQDITNPVSAESMISNIDGILQDPALDWATGFFEWTQNVPGTGGARFGARVRQLNGQAFLRAFESLKGGGHITEIEGQKATEAIGRLDTAQRPEDYRAALTELQGLLKLGIERQKTGGEIQSNQSSVSEVEINGSTYRVEKVK